MLTTVQYGIISPRKNMFRFPFIHLFIFHAVINMYVYFFSGMPYHNESDFRSIAFWVSIYPYPAK